MINSDNIKFTIDFNKRLLLFAFAIVFCYVVTAAINGLFFLKFGVESPRVVAIASVIQDVILFITPAVITTMIITRQPAEFLNIRKTKLSVIIWAIIPFILFIPTMDIITQWNESIHFPESLSSLEVSLRSSELMAQRNLQVLLSANGTIGLILCVLTVGFLAGFSEEIFFRGAMLRLLHTSRMNKHLAIWIVAIIFSAVHMQFFGFVPRMFLGAYFGYMMWWTRSVWVPMLIHIMNNVIYVVAYRSSDISESSDNVLDKYTSGELTAIVGVTFVLAVLALVRLYRVCRKTEAPRAVEADSVVK
jgi:hypothetical protein